MTKRVILIRGLPGSGKSTLAKSIWIGELESGNVACWFEADQYFTAPDGTYNFDASKLRHAHAVCQDNFKRALEAFNGVGTVIVSNTFTTVDELRYYVDLAREHGIEPQIVTAHGSFGSIHNVPEATMQKMRARFDHQLKTL